MSNEGCVVENGKRGNEFMSSFRHNVEYVPLLVILIGLLSSCGPAPDTFGKLDLKKWRGDRGGCNGVRSTLVPAFRAEIQNLKGNSANRSIRYMVPDVVEEMIERKKFYV